MTTDPSPAAEIAAAEPPDAAEAVTQIRRLLAIMAALRNPDSGCPWDLEQDFTSIAPYTIEEAYEVADAIGRNDMADLQDELGDLLFQAVFHARMAEEAGAFDFADVARSIADKMERRHPHVFGAEQVASVEAQSAAWEEHKAQERNRKSGQRLENTSVLDDVPTALPALLRAHKLGRRMARAGFDWPDALSILGKVEEELDELHAEIRPEVHGGDAGRMAGELGDLLFTVAQIGRRLGIDPEEALRRANRKVERRFRSVEDRIRQDGRDIAALPMEELERYWRAAKAAE
ncbi:MAG: nucleoside triphosphate pyrophosphohydrolase [Rhodospirillaceae bacterium]|nr:nucleoside triphosphate pyrophosphohydrolase [Rhodospirillaceae bacterium]MYF86332.1 nucleoside triphosphate pyrophosphohydrolase [Rhodospirillaceae bacterium]MYH37404.1 nucleoside triphosphate pyrophosphohydrolase [Rhodospirillaceae bacterium]